MAKYEVTVTSTRVETWEVEASSPEEAAVNYDEGELVTEPDVHKQVADVREV